MSRLRRWPLAIVVLVALSGCGVGGDDGEESSRSETTTDRSTEAPTTASAPAPDRSSTTNAPSSTASTPSTAPGRLTTTAPTTGAPPTTSGPPPSAGPEHFMTPSGNIGCYLSDEAVRCDISEASWPLPPRPADCDLDWVYGMELGDDGVSVGTCAGDTVMGGPVVLAYGSATARGAFRCESSTAGVTCTNTVSGMGFRLSREAYQVF